MKLTNSSSTLSHLILTEKEETRFHTENRSLFVLIDNSQLLSCYVLTLRR